MGAVFVTLAIITIIKNVARYGSSQRSASGQMGRGSLSRAKQKGKRRGKAGTRVRSQRGH